MGVPDDRFNQSADALRDMLFSYRSVHGIPEEKYVIPKDRRSILNYDATVLSRNLGSNAIDGREAYGNAKKNLAKVREETLIGPVLDIGCGEGYFLNELTFGGIDCVGLDASLTEVALARHGYPVGPDPAGGVTMYYQENVDKPVVWAPIIPDRRWDNITKGMDEYRFNAGAERFWDKSKNSFKDDCFGYVNFEGVLMMVPFSEYLLYGHQPGKYQQREIQQEVIDDIFRVTKPGGRVKISTLGKDEPPTNRFYRQSTVGDLRRMLVDAGFDDLDVKVHSADKLPKDQEIIVSATARKV